MEKREYTLALPENYNTKEVVKAFNVISIFCREQRIIILHRLEILGAIILSLSEEEAKLLTTSKEVKEHIAELKIDDLYFTN